jgi:large repetitive protein
MRNNYAPRFTFLKLLLLLFVAFALPLKALSQIYKHDFGTTAISSYPYTVAPPVLNANLSASSWQNSVGTWASNTGDTGQAIQLNTPAGTSTITLTFNVAAGFAADITSFDFWSKRSNSGPQNWQLAINGTTVGNGIVTTAGAALGTTPVSTPITGLTGTVTVTLSVSNAGGGNIRLDDFTLNGSVYSNCNTVVVNSFSPASGPENTQVTINGTGFTSASSVKFDGINATFTIVSNTQIKAYVPTGITTGTPSVTATDGCQSIAASGFTTFTSQCGEGEIYISELYDQDPGSGGMIELYNPANVAVTFNGQYVIQRFGNIGDTTPTAGYILTLPGAIAAHSTYLINCSTPDPSQCVAPLSSVNLGGTSGGFNGNDKIELLKNNAVIDRVNVPFTAAGFTLIRKPTAIAPTPVYNVTDWNNTDNPDTSSDPVPLNNFCANLGMHTVPSTIPAITQPQPQTVCEGSTAVFSVAVAGTGYSYQWKVLANGGSTWINVVSGVNYFGDLTDTLTIINTPAAFSGTQYYCEITSATCDISSSAALLTVGGVLAAPQATVTDATCATLGQAVVTSPLGAGMNYNINGGAFQSSVTFPNLPAGSYSIIAKNAAGCTSAPFTFTIQSGAGAPTAPVFGTPTQPTCATPTGSITITAPTGTGITYSTDGTTYQAGTTFNLAPGTYSVTAKNAAGCVSAATSLTINPAPSAPTAPVFGTPTQPTCANATGSITITSPTGTGITYSTDGTTYQAGTTFSLAPGTYSVTAKNAAGCVSPATSLTINPAPGAPTAPVFGTPTQPTCATPTGSITITAPTGTGITYSTDGTTYQAGTTFSLAPGTYSVTAKNAAGCVSPATSLTINPAPAAPSVASVTATQPDCNSATGSLTVTAPVGAYEYSLNGGTYQTGVTFAGLTLGSYTITTKNADGCTSVTAPIAITTAQPVLPPPTLTVTQTDCNTALGSITVVSPLGAGYTYSIDGVTYDTDTTFANLPPGTYSITVKNASGCISLATVKAITPQPSTPAAPGAAVTQQPDCNVPTGTITVTSAGTGFMYSVNGINYQNSNIFNDLPAGTYNITVRNSAGCVSPAVSRTINAAPAGPAAPAVIAASPADCSTSTGSLTVLSPTGAGLTYSIDGVNYQTGLVFTGLPAGSYPVTVKNAAGCISVANVKVIDGTFGAPAAPTLLDIQPDCTHPLGSITVTAPVGTGLSYSIDGGLTYQAGVTFSNLEPGSYSVQVKNAAGCISSASPKVITAFAGAPTRPVVTVTDPDCSTATGSITITAPVAAGMTYSINGAPYQAATTYSPLAPGTYHIIAKNGAGCISLTTTITIKAAPAIPDVPTVTATQPTCSTLAGKITVVSPFGMYTYSIDGGTTYQTSPVFDGLGGGTYFITVKNAAGCTAISTAISIDSPPTAAPSPGVITGANQLCMGDMLTLTESVTGGVWSSSNDAIATVDAAGVVTPVRAGMVQIVYTVGTQCTDTAQHTVTVYGLPQLNLNDIWLCEDPATGLITGSKYLTTGLSDTDYTFVWSKGSTVLPDTSASLEVDETGDYTVIATNILTGCSNSTTATVGVSSIAIAAVEVVTDFSNSQTITVTVTGGSGDYEYSLSGLPYQDEPVFRGITHGEYTVTVRDKQGCGIVELTVFALNYPHYFSPNGDSTHETWNIKDLAGQRDAVIFVFDRFGKIITSVYPSGHGWDGTLNGYPLPATDYWFTLFYTSSSGDRKEFKAHFSLIR